MAASALGLLAAACVSATGAGEGGITQAQCPALENVDLRELRALAEENVAESNEAVQRFTSATPLPEAAANADTRIRVRVPPTGMWAQDNLITLWRAEDGWHVARQDKDYRRPPPPPPPPNAPADWAPPPNPNDVIHEGPIGEERSAQLDALLADPCLTLEPDRYSWKIPLQRGQDWVCVPDSSYWAAEIIQRDRPPRLISIGCENRTLTSALVQFASGQRPYAPPAEPEIVLPYSATFEVVGDYAGREMTLTVDRYYMLMGRLILLPSGESWKETIPVADENPLTLRMEIEGCEPFEGQFRPGPNVATLIVEGCTFRLVQ
ncbi:MAG TPA: hypothetical protein PLS69_01375, partial [Terricaulis sp.]|nr:hypothetical protein [Terricaulis sp.]